MRTFLAHFYPGNRVLTQFYSMKHIISFKKGEKMNTNISQPNESENFTVLLWVFFTVNFMYCDTLSSLEPGVLQCI